jgi:hypothetical protein
MPTPTQAAQRLRTALLRNSSMTVFLALLILMVFIVPVVAPPFDEAGRAILEAFFALMLLAGAWVAIEDRIIAIMVALLCACVAAVAWFSATESTMVSPTTRAGVALVATLLLLAIVGKRVFASGRITMDRIMGAIAFYLIVGIVWANAYEIVALSDPSAFSGVADQRRGMERWYYFSFVTLTTVGYGDVTPLARAARALAMLEALIGQLYPAIILGRLVTLQTSADPSRPPAR